MKDKIIALLTGCGFSHSIMAHGEIVFRKEVDNHLLLFSMIDGDVLGLCGAQDTEGCFLSVIWDEGEIIEIEYEATSVLLKEAQDLVRSILLL